MILFQNLKFANDDNPLSEKISTIFVFRNSDDISLAKVVGDKEGHLQRAIYYTVYSSSSIIVVHKVSNFPSKVLFIYTHDAF